MTNDHKLDDLHLLLRVNRDTEESLRAAAAHIRNSELETLLSGYAGQHAKFAAEMREEIKRLGGDESETKTKDGALHRGWMDLKAALVGTSVHSLLSSCESGEESVDAEYLDAMDRNPSGHIHALLEKQRQQVVGFHTHLRRLAKEARHFEFPANENRS